MAKSIDEAVLLQLQKCKDLPTPPAVAVKIIELSGTKNSDIDALASIVAMDPALSAKMLGIANSSLYMRRVEADSIQQAVMMFGWSGTLNIALSFAVTGAIHGNLSSGINHDYVWRRCLAAAVSACKLGEVIGHKDEKLLFLPALLQDIGMLALDRAVPDLYEGIAEKQQDHIYLQDLEQDKINADHAMIGGWLLQTWKLPQQITHLVAMSHSALSSKKDEELIEAQRIIYLSGYIADCLVANEEFQNVERVGKLVEKHLTIPVSDFFPILGQTATQFLEMAAIFEIEVENKEQIQSMQEFSALTAFSELNY